MFSPLVSFISSLSSEFTQISPQRKSTLEQLTAFIQSQQKQNKPSDLIFICTHNSRRSHFAQLWAQALASYYGIDDLRSYSGGMQSSTFSTEAIRAIGQAGFQLKTLSHGDNPLYEVRFSEDEPGISAFSKTFDHPANPKENFCAILTCDEVIQNCPTIPGAVRSIHLGFEDPKAYDGTSLAPKGYADRSRQIGRELAYAFSLVSSP